MEPVNAALSHQQQLSSGTDGAAAGTRIGSATVALTGVGVGDDACGSILSEKERGTNTHTKRWSCPYGGVFQLILGTDVRH